MSRIGVLCEDATDCDAMSEIIRRIAPGIGVTARHPGAKKGGCSALRKKAVGLMGALCRAGCTAIVLVHDLDRNPENNSLNDHNELYSRLAQLECPAGADRHICIPVEELEAWFWSDQDLITWLSKGTGKAARHPETIARPKEALRNLVFRAHRKAVYSTNMNEKLAKELNLSACAERCPSFRRLRDFVQGTITPSALVAVDGGCEVGPREADPQVGGEG